MFEWFELQYLALFNGKGPRWKKILFFPFLRVLSWIYRLAIAVRNWGYDLGLLRVYEVPIPMVVSIGNLALGGTGKTALALRIVSELNQQIPLGVIARGYRSLAERMEKPIFVSAGDGPLYPAAVCGDEPRLIAELHPHTVVIVGRDRTAAARMAMDQGVKVLLLDDAMQHRRLGRDMEIVLLDGRNPLGYGHLFPRGMLREPVSALRRASYVVVTHVRDPSELEGVRKTIEKYTNAPLIAMHYVIHSFLCVKKGGFKDLRGQKVAAFAGIGQPDRFVQTLQTSGLEVIRQLALPDHRAIEMSKLESFALEAKEQGATALVCTEKDRVKLPPELSVSLPIYSACSTLELSAGQEYWDRMIAKLSSLSS